VATTVRFFQDGHVVANCSPKDEWFESLGKVSLRRLGNDIYFLVGSLALHAELLTNIT
jgi:hypothetical protein